MPFDFEPLDLDSIKKECERLKKPTYEVDTSLSENELNEEIKKLKKILMKNGYLKEEFEEFEELEKFEQILELKELIQECETLKFMEKQTEKFKKLITPYKHDPSYPPLPKNPNGSLFGIGFIYDEDEDNRVLVAIALLSDMKNILAVYEHEGTITFYSKYPCEIKEIEVCGDNWSVFEYTSENGKWIECENERNIYM